MQIQAIGCGGNCAKQGVERGNIEQAPRMRECIALHFAMHSEAETSARKQSELFSKDFAPFGERGMNLRGDRFNAL